MVLTGMLDATSVADRRSHMVRAIAGLMMVGGLIATGCATVPKSHAQRSQLEQDALATLAEIKAKDPSVQPLLDQAAGYIVFPEIKQGGFVVGGAGGRGVVFENGKRTAFAEMSQASLGAQIGGQKFAELVIVRDRFTLEKIKGGSFDFGGQASATILRAGAASSTRFGANGVAVVVNPIGGAMVSLSVTGQRIKTVM
jgi:lipid-binding SYLF domain-containing protein